MTTTKRKLNPFTFALNRLHCEAYLVSDNTFKLTFPKCPRPSTLIGLKSSMVHGCPANLHQTKLKLNKGGQVLFLLF